MLFQFMNRPSMQTGRSTGLSPLRDVASRSIPPTTTTTSYLGLGTAATPVRGVDDVGAVGAERALGRRVKGAPLGLCLAAPLARVPCARRAAAAAAPTATAVATARGGRVALEAAVTEVVVAGRALEATPAGALVEARAAPCAPLGPGAAVAGPAVAIWADACERVAVQAAGGTAGACLRHRHSLHELRQERERRCYFAEQKCCSAARQKKSTRQ